MSAVPNTEFPSWQTGANHMTKPFPLYGCNRNSRAPSDRCYNVNIHYTIGDIYELRFNGTGSLQYVIITGPTSVHGYRDKKGNINYNKAYDGRINICSVTNEDGQFKFEKNTDICMTHFFNEQNQLTKLAEKDYPAFLLAVAEANSHHTEKVKQINQFAADMNFYCSSYILTGFTTKVTTP